MENLRDNVAVTTLQEDPIILRPSVLILSSYMQKVKKKSRTRRVRQKLDTTRIIKAVPDQNTITLTSTIRITKISPMKGTLLVPNLPDVNWFEVWGDSGEPTADNINEIPNPLKEKNQQHLDYSLKNHNKFEIGLQ